MISIRITKTGFLLPVRVTPKGGRDSVLAFKPDDTELRLKVSAPPEDGKANVAVLCLLADVAGISKSELSLASGETSRHKQVCFGGLTTEAEIEPVLNKLAEAAQSQRATCFVPLTFV